MQTFEAKTGLRYIETNKDTPAKLDGVLVREKEIVAVVETKVRSMTEQDLKDFGTYLITESKITKGQKVSELLESPLFVAGYLEHSNVMYGWRVTDEKGNLLFDYETDKRETQETVNGGTKIDTVALLPVEKGNRYDLKPKKILS